MASTMQPADAGDEVAEDSPVQPVNVAGEATGQSPSQPSNVALQNRQACIQRERQNIARRRVAYSANHQATLALADDISEPDSGTRAPNNSLEKKTRQTGSSNGYCPWRNGPNNWPWANKEPPEPPWGIRPRDLREKWTTIFPMLSVIVGLGIAAFQIWDGVQSVSRNRYCPVLVDEFDKGYLDNMTWTAEIGVGDYGVGQFDQTTNDTENIFVRDGTLFLKPTPQNASVIDANYVLDLRADGCTGTTWAECIAVTNTTNGTTVNPVKSARIHTRFSANIKFGRVEVVAKLPKGDWIWPSITMLPTDNFYGTWPKSGEIDIVQSRGNNYSYKQGGNNVMSSCLHFGPGADMDASWRTNAKSHAYPTTFSDEFHKFGVEWTDKYIFTYIDMRPLQVLYTHFKKPFWTYGKFPTADRHGDRYINPGGYGTLASPFDRDFYLVLRVGAGSLNGWFEDNVAGKPWLDSDKDAKLRFWKARHQWAPTWEEAGWMEVKSVKMWQLAPHRACKMEEARRLVG